MWHLSSIRLISLAALCLLPATLLLAQTPASIPADPGPGTSQLEAALTRRGSIDFQEIPLRDVAEAISRQFKVPIVLSLKKLEEASVNPDTPITKKLDDLTLESILRLILQDLELCIIVRDEVLQVTTPEDAESQLLTRVYPVLDLVSVAATPKPDAPKDYDSLINMIMAAVRPDSWDDVGGPGAIDALANAESLVISQTRDVHREIEGLLSALRKAKTLQGLTPAGPSPGQPGISSP